MGDILIIDVSGKEGHGRVLARLATEDCEKYGNRSYHKLVIVAGEYVVSSQWLEPVEVRKPGGPADEGLGLRAHQGLTIWEAWNRRVIEDFTAKKFALLSQESDACGD